MGDAIIDDPKGASDGKVLGKGWETGNFKTSIETNNDMAANGVLLILTKFPEFEAKFLKICRLRANIWPPLKVYTYMYVNLCVLPSFLGRK